jgi:plastocyanin
MRFSIRPPYGRRVPVEPGAARGRSCLRPGIRSLPGLEELFVRRQTAALVMALLTLTACAPTAPAAAPAGGNDGGGSATGQPAGDGGQGDGNGGGADCTKASKVTIAADGSISPEDLTLRRGAFIFVTNKSGAAHKLVAEPDAGLVTSVLGEKEKQVIQFPETGTFTVSAGAGNSAQMHVTVKGDSGCGKPEPTLTIEDGYAFEPDAIEVAATANFTVVNKSKAAHGILCDPDPGGNGDNTRLAKGESQILAFDKRGTYTCHSVQHPDAEVKITVH